VIASWASTFCRHDPLQNPVSDEPDNLGFSDSGKVAHSISMKVCENASVE
jgi:hypothetical protein